MSVSIYVNGVIPLDGEMAKKKKAYEACLEAGVEPPEKLLELFGDVEESFDKYGVKTEAIAECQEMKIKDDNVAFKERASGEEAIYIDLDKLRQKYKEIKYLKLWVLY